jgi:hypothetical protein
MLLVLVMVLMLVLVLMREDMLRGQHLGCAVVECRQIEGLEG